jgi:transcriptional regulator with XRE-family HTH domain
MRRLRTDRGWTLREASARIGIGVAHVRRLEAGLGNPSLRLLICAARAFGVSLTELLRRP